jgi:hypothetical protein
MLGALKSLKEALAREIDARTKPRLIEIKPEPRRKLTRQFLEIPKERRNGVPFTEEELYALRGGRTAEEYRLFLIRSFLRN